jgi:REP element-mobilizing transposase RayT
MDSSIPARDITLECCKFIHQKSALLHVALVMPDHVHLILSPLIDEQQKEIIPLAKIMNQECFGPSNQQRAAPVLVMSGRMPVWSELRKDWIRRLHMCWRIL